MNEKELIKWITSEVLAGERPAHVLLYNVLVNITIDMLKEGKTPDQVQERIRTLFKFRENV